MSRFSKTERIPSKKKPKEREEHELSSFSLVFQFLRRQFRFLAVVIVSVYARRTSMIK